VITPESWSSNLEKKIRQSHISNMIYERYDNMVISIEKIQFKDDKKEGSIELSTMHGTDPVFLIKIEKPVVAQECFRNGDIRTQQGVTGIYCSAGSTISKAFGTPKNSRLLVMSDDVFASMRQLVTDEINKLTLQSHKNPDAWKWNVHYGDIRDYISLRPVSDVHILDYRPDLKIVQETICANWQKIKLGENSTSNPDGSYTISHDTLMMLYSEISEKLQAEKEKYDKIKAENQANKEAKQAEIFELAKNTGQKQVLSTQMVDCNDPHEECSTDVITTYAMPDGTRSEVRNHTW
jgi:hypothetical protein